ncbi:MAG TPA: YihY/virulence factor BrkB family protein [Micromonosporaceae bacterium]|jgi:YihY family inner membrane protein
MSRFRAMLHRLDRYQQRHRAIGFPLAVIQKFNDDQAGDFAKLLAWNAFISIFPLLLVLVTVLGIVLRGHDHLQHQVLHSALVDFPIIGGQLQANIHSLDRTGISLVIGLIGIFIGTRGVANAAQNALNGLWEVPHTRRPGFPLSLLRSLALVLSFGLGIIITTSLSGIGGAGGAIGIGERIGAVAVSFVLNVALFWLAFRLATASDVASRDLRVGAVLTAIIWQVLQTFGSYLVEHELRHASQVYGLFGIVLGLAFWLFLQAELSLYMVEADVVRTRHLWPRAIFTDELTRADKSAYTAYAQVEERKAEEDINVAFASGNEHRIPRQEPAEDSTEAET